MPRFPLTTGAHDSIEPLALLNGHREIDARIHSEGNTYAHARVTERHAHCGGRRDILPRARLCVHARPPPRTDVVLTVVSLLSVGTHSHEWMHLCALGHSARQWYAQAARGGGAAARRRHARCRTYVRTWAPERSRSGTPTRTTTTVRRRHGPVVAGAWLRASSPCCNLFFFFSFSRLRK